MIDSRTVKMNLGNALPTLSKTAVAAILGLATLVITFAISVAALDRTERLDYESIANSLIFSVVAALFLFALAQWYSPFQSRVTGDNRKAFMRFAVWASLILPLEAVSEDLTSFKWHHAVAFRRGACWLTLPSQFIVAGLLGLSVAISNRKWILAIWGVICILWGGSWIVTTWAR